MIDNCNICTLCSNCLVNCSAVSFPSPEEQTLKDQTRLSLLKWCNSQGTFSFQAADLSKPIDKRIYKGTQPTCHDFNHLTATAESVSLLVGFSAGQVQLIDPIKKETSKLFNEEVIVLVWLFLPVEIRLRLHQTQQLK